MREIITDWAEVKRVSNDLAIPVQHVRVNGEAWVFVVNGTITVSALLQEGSEEYAEFESSYKAPPGRRVSMTLSSLSNPENFRFRGTTTAWTQCPAGATAIDLPALAEERWVDGGEVVVKDANPGDWVTFSVVHPVYGVVETFVPSWTVVPGTGRTTLSAYPARVPAGMILRMTYTNTVGGTTPGCAVNYRLHKRGA